MKRSSLHCLLLICLLSILPQPTRAQEKFTVCIGDICRGDGPGAANYIYGCGFARANPANTDEAAAKRVCLFENPGYTGYDFLRYGAGSGGECGVIFVLVICKP